ncbi:MAG TPA: diadenylate cyclase CdaA [Sandaracinaceae bacterium LLY-WYZ-13_1]|nr:diadenylate cyclase CdaA [Sandaracinaceae bacterium LLY-WYZ-13_1]
MTEVLDGLYAFFFERETLRVLVDVLDILLVAYLFYRVLLLIRGTRAMQMGVGLALVFLVYNLARRTGLITLFTILDALLTYVVIIIVILFQNDIRRALMRVGARPFFRKGQSARESQVIEEVVKASQALAQKRIGALVVFEREAALDEFIEHGTKLDAAVSKELLYSIFVPSYENPMHDGAVVIRDGRVWEAGAFLPLTESTKVDRTLGTRHRAAIGISEETDAVVVVVSEERGSASLCFNGNIVRDLDTNMLRQALVGLFEKRAAKSKPKGKGRPRKSATDSTGRTSHAGDGADDEPARPARTSTPSGSSAVSRAEAEETAP